MYAIKKVVSLWFRKKVNEFSASQKLCQINLGILNPNI